MSLRTRINGFTAWVNLRLTPSGHFMHNILTDLLKGYNMKVLLKEDNPKDTYVDSRMFAMRCADQVFDLLWCLVCHDIWFVWERSEFLHRLKWTPPPPPPKTPTHKIEKSMLSGFANKITDSDANWHPGVAVPKPNNKSDDMVTKRHRSRNYPSPEYCILDMVNAHLKMNREGRENLQESLSDLTDSRVLCALVNSFVPETFTTEVDNKPCFENCKSDVQSSNPFDSQDLVEDELNVLKIGIKDEMEQFPSLITNVKDLKRKKELENLITVYDEEIQFLDQNYDIVKCNIWIRQVAEIQNKCRAMVAEKIVQRFDVVKVPRITTINDLAVDMIINLVRSQYSI
ncbi:hypothetical protein OS493_038975 [Desmophyllum pertusum]|uniref:Uncharacterized protein n=1 Tax=Desmophyllum pertusum TaxID=174260 RepID=A0A9X0D1U8_9CNID|nr:hypothetical protein OS493_038975 [Desmophyllum pertusum]